MVPKELDCRIVKNWIQMDLYIHYYRNGPVDNDYLAL